VISTELCETTEPQPSITTGFDVHLRRGHGIVALSRSTCLAAAGVNLEVGGLDAEPYLAARVE
jgi:hypothetical protein